ncbi:ParA family protein [Nocardia farcinica]|uniref:ParA family protein n=1 Tax=Nocardia farcinica TaxID=37329 RepID=UPI001893BDF0|nr:ParA family protein [Nocardia farcinica]MBF6072698.1 ParA family protein [Nocardia farcinica]
MATGGVLRLLFSTLKGGPGKTTSAILTAIALSRRGLTVVVICADTRTRGATDWVQEAERVGDVVPFRLAIWHESDGPLSQYARGVERSTGADVVIIDTGGEQPENFTHGCLYADWLIAPVGPFRAELRRLVPTYQSAAAVDESGSHLEISVLLTRCPAAHKGKAKEAREQLTSNLVGEDGQLDPEVPYALGLDVLNTEISRGVAYDEFYGLMPEDVGEYDALANEILDRRSRTS